MAVQDVNQQISKLQKAHGAALSNLKRTRKVVRALRNLTESKLEKSLVVAGYEAIEKAYDDMGAMGARLKELSQSLKAAGDQPAEGNGVAGVQVENQNQPFSE